MNRSARTTTDARASHSCLAFRAYAWTILCGGHVARNVRRELRCCTATRGALVSSGIPRTGHGNCRRRQFGHFGGDPLRASLGAKVWMCQHVCSCNAAGSSGCAHFRADCQGQSATSQGTSMEGFHVCLGRTRRSLVLFLLLFHVRRLRWAGQFSYRVLSRPVWSRESPGRVISQRSWSWWTCGRWVAGVSGRAIECFSRSATGAAFSCHILLLAVEATLSFGRMGMLGMGN